MITVRRAALHDSLELAKLLYADYPAAEQEGLLASLVTAESRDPPAAFWIATEDERVAGVCAAELQPGKVGYITGPAGDRLSPEAGEPLLHAAHAWCESKGALLLQSLLPAADHPAADPLLRAGYEHRSDLLYLVAATESFPLASTQTDLVLEPYQPARDSARLAALIDRTYLGSLDLPPDRDERSLAETLAGYAASGNSGTTWWFFLRSGGTDAGCLLLADYPELNQWELVYIGLAPEARGEGLGLQAVQRAQSLVRGAGRGRLVLAVDEANWPAIGMYAAAGFEAWNRRSVFLRKVASNDRK